MVQPATDLIFSGETAASFFIFGGVPLNVLECLQGPIDRIRDQIGRDQVLAAELGKDSMPHQAAS